MPFTNVSAVPGLQFDNPVVMFQNNGGVGGLGLITLLNQADVSQYQQVIYRCSSSNGIVGSGVAYVEFQWYGNLGSAGVTPVLLAVDHYDISANDPSQWIFNLNIPVRGSFLTVLINKGVADNPGGISILGSFRTLLPTHGWLYNRILLDTGDIVIVPGAGPARWPAFRYDGPVSVYFRVASASAVGIFNIIDDRSGALIQRYELNTGTVVAGDKEVSCTMPRTSWYIRLDNNTGANINVCASVIAAPESI